MPRITSMAMVCALLSSGCGNPNESVATEVPSNAAVEALLPAETTAAADRPVEDGPAATQLGLSWQTATNGEGTTLRLVMPDGSLRMSVACLGDPQRLVVNAPNFEPIESEDRFSFGLGSEPITLVANPYAQKEHPGVTGEGAIPPNLGELLASADRVTALYGTQQVGPHIAPPPGLAGPFAVACEDIRTLG